MSALKGFAVVTGADGITMTLGIVSGTDGAHNQSVTHSREADHKFLKNGAGDTVCDFITDKKQMVSMSVVPYSVATPLSAAAAIVSKDAYRLASGTKVTIADSKSTVIDGDYLLLSSKENRSNDNWVVIDLELVKYEDNDITLATTA